MSRITGLLPLCLALMIGCGEKPWGRSNLGTTSNGREVKASLDGPGSISSTDDAASITFAGGKLIVGKSAITLDGKELAQLPETAKSIAVDYTRQKLTVTADGTEVFSKELSK